MPHYKYLIVGGGMTADAAARAIRKIDSGGSLGIVSAETVPPYDRPPLPKKLWTGEPLESNWRKTCRSNLFMWAGLRTAPTNQF